MVVVDDERAVDELRSCLICELVEREEEEASEALEDESECGCLLLRLAKDELAGVVVDVRLEDEDAMRRYLVVALVDTVLVER